MRKETLRSASPAQRCGSAAVRGPQCNWSLVHRQEGRLLGEGGWDASLALLRVRKGMVCLLGLNSGISRSFTFGSSLL